MLVSGSSGGPKGAVIASTAKFMGMMARLWFDEKDYDIEGLQGPTQSMSFFVLRVENWWM